MLYGAAEYSRDLDLAVLATPPALPALIAALDALHATVIAVPPFEVQYLERGHAVHFRIPDDTAAPLRVDIMSRLRGVDPFPVLWERRTTIALPDPEGGEEVLVEVLALEDLVAAKKTQRDKDWPMLRRLVDASYAAARDGDITEAQVSFWLAELRSPAFLAELVARCPDAAERSLRPAVQALLRGQDVEAALAAEQAAIMAEDRAYWAPLRRELEALRLDARRAE
ncbi:MAG: hypothetical protein ABR551_03255 [Gemmatimonadales bacterium]